MSTKSREKKKVRALQERTGWSYSECLLRIRTMSPEGIDALVALRAGEKVRPIDDLRVDDGEDDVGG